MMKNFLIVILGTMLIAGCSSISVTTDYDKTADFNSFKTYSFYEWKEESDKLLTPFDKKRIKTSVGEELEARGYKFVEGKADLTVSLFVVLEQKTSRTAYTNHYGGGYYGYDDWGYGYPGGWGMGSSTTTYSETDYIDGTLVIDIFDTNTRKLVWQGVGSGTVDEDPEKRDKTMPHEIAQIFYKFPKKKITTT
jgi:hypothetical protein